MFALLLACASPTPSSPATGDDTAAPAPVELVLVSAAPLDGLSTVIEVRWSQSAGVAESWLAYSFDGEDHTSPVLPRLAGEHSEVLLGLPADTELRFRVVVDDGQGEQQSEPWQVSTGLLPEDLVEPTWAVYDPVQSSPEGYVLGSVSVNADQWYKGPFYVIILDRWGRIIWYWAVPDDKATMVPRVARDGGFIRFEETTTYNLGTGETLLRELSLDLAQHRTISASQLVYAWDETSDGALLCDWKDEDVYSLVELTGDDEVEPIWSCLDWADPSGGRNRCYTNTVNWDEASDTVFWSMPTTDTVVQIDRGSGALLRSFGGEGYDFEPADAVLEFQHFPNLTPQGTLLTSSHAPGEDREQRIREYALDDAAQTLVQVWSYGEGVNEYAHFSGEATRLANGNTLINFGTGGGAHEVTSEGELVWEIFWPGLYLTGHMSLVEDLYTLR